MYNVRVCTSLCMYAVNMYNKKVLYREEPSSGRFNVASFGGGNAATAFRIWSRLQVGVSTSHMTEIAVEVRHLVLCCATFISILGIRYGLGPIATAVFIHIR